MKRAILLAVVAAVVGVAPGAVLAGANQPGADEPRAVALPPVDCLPGVECDPINLGWQDEL
ncbi:hypothetical protein ACWEPL_62760 [Nonomuraea sp. NPDC004186]